MAQTLTDQMGRVLHLDHRPKRIVSLCPSTSETLAHLIPAGDLVGRTSYCTRPSNLMVKIADVGGTKTLDLQKIEDLAPDLIVSVREENDASQIAVLANTYPTLILDPVDLSSMLAGIDILGLATRQEDAADGLRRRLEAALGTLPRADGQRVIYLIWRKPYMAAGASTYISAVLTRLGFTNAPAKFASRYPELSVDQMKALKPDIIFASSEPFPFSEKHVRELEKVFAPCPVRQVDGEAFGWHGARLLETVSTLRAVVADMPQSRG